MSSSSSTSPATSPRSHVLPQQPSETLPQWTKWDLPNSEVIRDNLKRVLEYKEYRIHGAYITGITALRAGIEVIPRAGKVLLDTATWFVDTNRPRGEGYTIIRDGLIDVIDCIKVTIALPFFAIAGIIFPADVFGLLENIPGFTSQAEASKQHAELEESEIAKINLDAAGEELDNLILERDVTNEELIVAQARLDVLLENIATHEASATAAEQLKAEVLELHNRIGDLTRQEGTQSGILDGIQKEIGRLGSVLESAQNTRKDDLARLEREKAEKETELKRIQLELNQAIGSQAATKAQSQTLSATLRDLAPKAEEQRAELERLQQSVAQLQEKESSLQAQVQQQLDKLAKAADDFDRNKESNNATLRDLQTQIAGKESDLLERRQRLEQLGREEADLSSKQAELKKQYEQLRDATLPELIAQRDALKSEADEHARRRDAITIEIAKEEQDLATKRASLEAVETKVAQLEQLLTKLGQQETTFRKETIPELEQKAEDLKQQQSELSACLLAETARLGELTAQAVGKSGELEKLGLELARKRAEQESLERTLAEAREAHAKGETASSQLIERLQTQAHQLGQRVAELEADEASLKRKTARQHSELDSKKAELTRVASELEAVEGKIVEFRTQQRDLNESLSALRGTIVDLKSEQTALTKAKSALDQEVETLTTSVEETTSRLQSLELQTRDVEKREKEASAELAALQPKLVAARREKDEIQGAIASVRPELERLENVLKESRAEKAALEASIPKLQTEARELNGQISTAQLDLSQVREGLERTKSAHAAEMQELAAAKTQLKREIAGLESDMKVKTSSRDALQQEFESLEAVTAKLRVALGPLQEQVKLAEEAKETAREGARAERETLARLRLEEHALFDQVQTLKQETTALAEKNQKLDTAYTVRQLELEEALHRKARDAMADVAAKVQETRLQAGSPARTPASSPARTPAFAVKVQETRRQDGSPARTPGASSARGPLPTSDTSNPPSEDVNKIVRDRRHEERRLARAIKANDEAKVKLVELEQKIKAEKAKIKEDLDRETAELARLKKEKETTELEVVSRMSQPDFAAQVKKREEKYAKLIKDEKRLTDRVAALRKERDAALAAESVDASDKSATNGRRVSFQIPVKIQTSTKKDDE